MKNKVRLQFDLPRRAVEDVEALGRKIGITTRAAVVRQALDLLMWLVEVHEEGGAILLEKGDENVKVAFPLLSRVIPRAKPERS